MGKPISREQIMRLFGVYFTNVRLDGVDEEVALSALRDPIEAGKELSEFLKYGGGRRTIRLGVHPSNSEILGIFSRSSNIAEIVEDCDVNTSIIKLRLSDILLESPRKLEESCIMGDDFLSRIKARALHQRPLGSRALWAFWNEYLINREFSFLGQLGRLNPLINMIALCGIVMKDKGDGQSFFPYFYTKNGEWGLSHMKLHHNMGSGAVAAMVDASLEL